MNTTNINNPQVTNIKMFNDKMILSSAKGSKDILLWAENSGTIAFTYTDDNLKTFIPKDQLMVIGKELYSEYLIYQQENKSLFTIWNTGSTQFYSKFSVSDERIASIDLSYDTSQSTLLSIGTLTGMVYLYDIGSGNLLKSFQVSKGEIFVVKQIDNFLYVLDKDKLSSYLIGKLLMNSNDSFPKEINVYYQNDTLSYEHMLIASWANSIILWSNTQIMILNIIDLKPIKTFRLSLGNSKLITDVKVKYATNNELYLVSNKCEIFKIESEKYSNGETHQIEFFDNSSILLLEGNNNEKKQMHHQALTDITSFEFGSKVDTLLTGHDDGKLRLWNKMQNGLYLIEAMFAIHKGAVMNILVINKPISQYGLNFNKNIQETIVSKTSNFKEIIGETVIKIKEEYESYINDYVDCYTNEIISDSMEKIILKQQSDGDVIKKTIKEEDDGDVIMIGSPSIQKNKNNEAMKNINKYVEAYIDQ